MPSTVIHRDTAVAQIAAAITDRTHYVIVAPPHAVTDLAERLGDVPDWTGYVDSGTPVLLRTGQATAVYMAAALTLSTAVVLIPKTVPAATLTAAVGDHIPADGSRDLVLICGPDDEPTMWPLVFVDALAVVDPDAAAQITAGAT